MRIPNDGPIHPPWRYRRGAADFVKIVVERESAVLGYPNEVSSPLTADHHTICKYPSNLDSNYVNVRNVIKSLVEKLRPKGEWPFS